MEAKLISPAEEHRAEVILFSESVPSDARLLVDTSASHPHRLLRGGQAAALYLWGLRSGDEKTPAWEAQTWALNTAARALGGLSARWDNIDWLQARYAHLKALRGVLGARYAPSTANRILGAVRSVLEEAWQTHQYDREELERVKSLEPVAGTRLPPGRLLEPDEVSALITSCVADGSTKGARDGALIACLYGCGLRRVEASRLLCECVLQEELRLTVIGKGNKERAVPYQPAVQASFARWLAVRGVVSGPFICRTLRWGGILRRNNEPVGIQPGGVWEALWHRAIALEMKAFTPHDLRRSYITHLLDSGADIAAVQKLVGHTDPTTTAAYDRRPAERLREIAAALPYPTTGAP